MATYDVGAFRPSTTSHEYRQVLADETDSGLLFTGIDKLAQRFLLQFMTRKGSIPKSTAGCEFVDRLTTGRVATELDVFLAASSSISTAVNAVKSEEAATDPDDEKIAGVRVNSLKLATGDVSLSLTIRNKAGVAKGVSVPLTFLLP